MAERVRNSQGIPDVIVKQRRSRPMEAYRDTTPAEAVEMISAPYLPHSTSRMRSCATCCSVASGT